MNMNILEGFWEDLGRMLEGFLLMLGCFLVYEGVWGGPGLDFARILEGFW